MVGPSSAQSAAVTTSAPDVVPQVGPYPSRPGDVTIARAVADAVRSLPMVFDLSPGLVALAATYGPRARVTGVVVRHPSPQETTVEVHVILRVALRAESPGDGSEGADSSERAPGPAPVARDSVLTRAADEIRGAVYRAAQRLGMASPAEVDVLIDDIQTAA